MNTFDSELRTFSQMTDSQQKETISKGLIVEADDLSVGMLVTVYQHKDSDAVVPVMGMPLKVRAINLPYILTEIIGQGDILPLDIRYLEFQRITQEYADVSAFGLKRGKCE
jgi:hypothetical protein